MSQVQQFEKELPRKVIKKTKGYYLPIDVIEFVKDESARLSIKPDPEKKIVGELISENDVLTAIVRCYQKTSMIDGDGGPAYETGPKLD